MILMNKKKSYFVLQAKESLSQFMEAFDIVLVDDQTMNVVLEMIDLIV